MPHDPVLIAETRSWLSKAARDLATADFEFTADPPFLEDITFHAQQAVEKTLKGFLCWHGRTFRKTHNLVELGQSCAQIDGTLEPLLRRAAPLTEYVWKFRYPGEYEEPICGEATEALNLAREICDAVLVRLPDSVRP
jgi:HEPN domain-containing protein